MLVREIGTIWLSENILELSNEVSKNRINVVCRSTHIGLLFFIRNKKIHYAIETVSTITLHSHHCKKMRKGEVTIIFAVFHNVFKRFSR